MCDVTANFSGVPKVDVKDLVLAALAAGGQRTVYNPTHVQKLFFLIDRELAAWVDGPHFNFQPYHYGPFDRKVYDVLTGLAAKSLVTIHQDNRFPVYALTEQGQFDGYACLAKQSDEVVRSLTQCARWVRTQSFQSLLTEIYERYPDMTVNSRVPDLVDRARNRRAHSSGRAFARGAGSILNLYPERHTTHLRSAAEALAEDWQAIGNDLRNSVVPFPVFPTE